MVFSARNTLTGRRDNCCLCLNDPSSVPPENVFTRKDIVMMEIFISYFHTSLYIPEIKRLVFHLPHVRLLGTHHCGTHAAKHLNIIAHFKMFFVVLIIPREW